MIHRDRVRTGVDNDCGMIINPNYKTISLPDITGNRKPPCRRPLSSDHPHRSGNNQAPTRTPAMIARKKR